MGEGRAIRNQTTLIDEAEYRLGARVCGEALETGLAACAAMAKLNPAGFEPRIPPVSISRHLRVPPPTATKKRGASSGRDANAAERGAVRS